MSGKRSNKRKKYWRRLCVEVEMPGFWHQKKWFILGKKITHALFYEKNVLHNKHWKETLLGNYINVSDSAYFHGQALISLGKVVDIQFKKLYFDQKHLPWTRNQFTTSDQILNHPNLALNYLKHDFMPVDYIRIKHQIKYWRKQLIRNQEKESGNEGVSHVKKRKRLVWLLTGIFTIITCLTIQEKTVWADNQDVKDGAGILSEKTEQEIKKINDNEMDRVKGHPQIAVVTTDDEDDSDSSMSDLADDMFDQYKFGHEGYDNGVLFIIRTKPHGWYIQTGYGLESVLPDVWCKHAVTAQDIKYLKKKQYNQVVLDVVHRISDRILDKSKNVKTKEQVAQHQKAEHSGDIILIVAIVIGVLVIGILGGIAGGGGSDDDSGGFFFGGDSDDNSGGFFFGGGDDDDGSFGGFGGSSGGGGAGGSW